MVESADGRVIVLLARYKTQHAQIVEGSTFDGVIEMIDAAIRER